MLLTILTLTGLGLVCAGWLHYLWLIPQERVPARPIIHPLLINLGGLLAVIGAVTGRVVVGLILASLAAVLAGLFDYLLIIAHLPPANLTLAVGQRWLPFTALDDAGQPVNSQTWQGQRLLLKFFRGQW